MNNDIESKVKRFKDIQVKLSKVIDNIKNEDISKFNEVWNDRNSVLFLEQLNGVCNNINGLIVRIDDTIKELSKYSNDGGVL